MLRTDTLYNTAANGSVLERVRYFPRQLITADDLTADQDYIRQKLRRHNRFLHGWGVVCGLAVTADPLNGQPWRVKIGAGYALGPYGDEIYVAEAMYLDLTQCGPGVVTDPCDPARLRGTGAITGGPVWIAIKYAECVAQPVQVMPAGCACDEEACEYSRIRDSFQIECLDTLPASHRPDPQRPSLCDFVNNRQPIPCLPCPDDPWVVLAQVDLPAPRTRIANQRIDNFVRRQIYSTAVLQEQLIACCCEEEEEPQPSPPLQVERVLFLNQNEVTSHFGGNEIFGGELDELTFEEGQVDEFRIQFSRSIDPDTVVSANDFGFAGFNGTANREEFSFLVTASSGELAEWNYVPGYACPHQTDIVRFFLQPPPQEETETFPPCTEARPSIPFVEGTYTVTLFGNEHPPLSQGPIADTDGNRLDGDYSGEQGGNYQFQFRIS